jgi:hypothetical protein
MEAAARAWGWCPSCARPCPGLDAEGFCRWREFDAAADADELAPAAGAPGDGPAAAVDGGGDGSPRPGAGGRAQADSVPASDAAAEGARVPAGVPAVAGGWDLGTDWPETLTRWQCDDPGAWRYQVYLDGEPVRLACRADVEAGEVVVTLTDAAGLAYGCMRRPGTADSDGAALDHRRETRTGRAEIRRRV